MCAHLPQTHHARVQPTRNKTQNHKSQGKKKRKIQQNTHTRTQTLHTHTSVNTSRRFDLKAVCRLRLLSMLSAVAVSVTGGVNTHTLRPPPRTDQLLSCAANAAQTVQERTTTAETVNFWLEPHWQSEASQKWLKWAVLGFFFFSSPTSQQVKSQQKHVFHQFVLHCVDDDMKQMSALWMGALTHSLSHTLYKTSHCES